MTKKQLIKNEIAMICLAGLLYGIYDVYCYYDPQNPYVQMAFAVAAAIVIFFLFRIMRRLWNKQFKSAVGRGIKRLFNKIAGIVVRYADKISFYFGKGNVVGGETTVRFDYSVFKARKNKPERFKPPKWKDMNTTREKLGFLYYKLITLRIKNGMEACPQDTPSELKVRQENSENEEKLFDIYITARYDERATVDEQEILDLKERLFD